MGLRAVGLTETLLWPTAAAGSPPQSETRFLRDGYLLVPSLLDESAVDPLGTRLVAVVDQEVAQSMPTMAIQELPRPA
jgi:hypothetical protein